ncbi:MAG TPA: GntR family transcriptional regulator [Casimicrobiaceae bacterium]|nr:GntR family transcriptional regulator [Casimicrobiaceae bacterium]
MDSDATSSQQRAYEYLKDGIASLWFRPRQHLKATEIARSLRLSRTPVKEALGRLEQEGLVKRDLGSGYIVESITARQLFDLYRVRELLEVEAAREALPKLDAAVLDRLEALIAQSEPLLREASYDEFLRASRRFHNEIAQVAGNTVLLGILGGLNDRIWSLGSIVVKKFPDRAVEILADNRALLAALRARDPVRVERAVRRHIKGATQAARRFMETQLHEIYFDAA